MRLVVPVSLTILMVLLTGSSGLALEAQQPLPWWKRAVVYEVYPRSFQDTDGDGMGDLRGITRRLDYIRSLGVDMFWLYSAYRSPDVDNGYDVSDYYSIDPRYGTMADFDEMLRQMHRRGLKLQMELVVNHSSDQNRWFQESRKSKDNPYRHYYIWQPGKNGGPPNDWPALTGGSAWELDPTTGEYYLHLFDKRQPDLNWDYPPLRQEIYRVMRFWLDKGVDGFRMDVIPLISKDQTFAPLGPRGVAAYEGGRHVHEYLQEMNREVLSHYDVATVGEGAFIEIERAGDYTASNRHELNMLFLFDAFGLGRGDDYEHADFKLSKLKEVVERWDRVTARGAWLAPFLESIDTPRIVSAWTDDGALRVPAAKMLATLLLTLRGTPYIYAGQEIGMTNAHFTSLDDFPDVEARTFIQKMRSQHVSDAETLSRLQFFGRDNGRTPMQWDASRNAGFSSAAKTWLKVNQNFRAINVAAEERDHDSVLQHYRSLIALHKSTLALIDGRVATDDRSFVYTRTLGAERYLVMLNFTREAYTISFPKELADRSARLLSRNYAGAPDELGVAVPLRPYEARVYKLPAAEVAR